MKLKEVFWNLNELIDSLKYEIDNLQINIGSTVV